MNLYLVTRTDTDRIGYDEYDAIVVAASTPNEAASLDPGGDAWDSERLHVRCIGKAHPWLYNEPTIVLGSFNAG